MAERRAKIRKVLGTKGIATNARALDAVLQALQAVSPEEREDFLEEKFTRWSLRGVANDMYVRVCVRRELPLLAGGRMPVDVLSFAKSFQTAVCEADGFRAMVRSAFRYRPCTLLSPWRVLLYADETTPGNILNLDYPRKVFVAHASVQEFGPSILKLSAAWLPLALLRTKQLEKVSGGMAALWTEILKQTFLDDDVGSGFVVDLGEDVGQQALYFSCGSFVLDGDAVRGIFGSKGGNPKCPCLACLNVVSDPALAGDGIVHSSTTDVRLFRFASNEDLWLKADRLAAPMRQADRQRLCVASGMNYIKESFLYAHELRPYVKPATSLMFDPMHILLSQGLADREYEHLLPKLFAAGVTWNDLDTYCSSDWRTGGKGLLKVSRIFRASKKKHFTMSGAFRLFASDHLALLPIFKHFLDTAVEPALGRELRRELQSFDGLACVIALVKEGKIGTGDADRLERAIRMHAEAFLAAYGDDGPISHKSKGHWLFHVPEQMRQAGFVIDCFVGERKHSMVKSCLLQIPVGKTFDTAALRRVYAANADHMSGPGVFTDTLHTKSKRCTLLEGDGIELALVARSLTWNGILISATDMLILNSSPCIVEAAAMLDGHLCVLVRWLELVAAITHTAQRWRIGGPLCVVPLADVIVVHPPAWHYENADTIVLLSL